MWRLSERSYDELLGKDVYFFWREIPGMNYENWIITVDEFWGKRVTDAGK